MLPSAVKWRQADFGEEVVPTEKGLNPKHSKQHN
jgi:hypothetical protein